MPAKKKIGLGLLILMAGFAFLSIISLMPLLDAYFVACFDKGDFINYCLAPDVTCTSDFGCTRCMSKYNETNQCYAQGSINACNTLANQSCSNFGGTGDVDSKAPSMTIRSPVEGNIYSSRSIILDMILSEEGDIYYTDNINGRGIWTRVCTDCYSYNHARSFKEGINDLTFKAVDFNKNEETKIIIFRVDSKKPSIKKTYPKREEFIGNDGEFSVEFQEINPKSLILSYGTYANHKTADVDLETCTSIKGASDKFLCSVQPDLTEFNGQEIEYWFTLKDIADTAVNSKIVNINVDYANPVIENPNDFWRQGIGAYKQYIYFNISITEQNLDEVGVNEIDSRGVLRYTKLCSALKNGYCAVKKSFLKGHHELTLQAVDEAGNTAPGLPVVFDVA